MAKVPALEATNARARPRLCCRAGCPGPRLASSSLALAGRDEQRSGMKAGGKALGVMRGRIALEGSAEYSDQREPCLCRAVRPFLTRALARSAILPDLM